MKVLLSAYACEPGRGSEPAVGWNAVCAAGRFCEVWVLTRANNRRRIEAALASRPELRVHWLYHDLPAWARFWKRGQRGVRLYYVLWQLSAWRRARALHGQIRFDLVHHVTFVNYWLPSFLALLPVPFIWGPLGGGDDVPRPFRRTFSWRGRAYETLRRLARAGGEASPLARFTARRAAAVLATTEATRARLLRLGAARVAVASQVALSETEIAALEGIPPRRDPPLRFLSLGRLLHLKGFHLGLEAFARARLRQAEYWVIGDGPERHRLERLAAGLGVGGQVRFLGSLPREEVPAHLGACHVLVHPSLHDSGGWVCVEAMAAGRPVICLDLGGPAVQVTGETGCKIPAHSPEEAVAEMARAMRLLAANPNLRAAMGAAGRKRVRTHFAAAAQEARLRQLYAQVAGAAGPAGVPALLGGGR